jgi:putative transposase
VLRRFGVGINTVIIWARRFRETGGVAPGKTCGHKPTAIWVSTAYGHSVAEFADRGLKVDYRLVWNFVHARSWSFLVASERDRPDVGGK